MVSMCASYFMNSTTNTSNNLFCFHSLIPILKLMSLVQHRKKSVRLRNDILDGVLSCSNHGIRDLIFIVWSGDWFTHETQNCLCYTFLWNAAMDNHDKTSMCWLPHKNILSLWKVQARFSNHDQSTSYES